jgi:hypothetical protein
VSSPTCAEDVTLRTLATVLLVSAVRASPRLPGEELVDRGLRDLAAGVESVEALLVSIGAPRLQSLGLSVPLPIHRAEGRLYRLLQREHGDGGHSRYNALVRRLVSFERAHAECVRLATPTGFDASCRRSALPLPRRVEDFLG